MSGKRVLRILALLPAFPRAEPSSSRLCEVAAEVASMSGAGIMLMAGDLAVGSLCSSNRVSATIEDLQFTLGEGPCVDAYNHDHPVLEPDLRDPRTMRWLAFTPLAVRAGAHAVFGFPLKAAGIRLGALNLYRDEAGPLTAEQHADALVMAEVVARAVVTMQAGAPAGDLAPEIEHSANLRVAVHQATGMVSAQLGIPAREALLRMRAYSFSNDMTLDDVAKSVLSRQLRFDNK